MNNEEYNKGVEMYENLVEDYLIEKIHYLIKEKKRINNIDYLIKRLRENVFDSYLEQSSYKAFNQIALDTKEDYGIYVYINDTCNKHKIFRNLETKTDLIIDDENLEEFLNNYKVIIPTQKHTTNDVFYERLRKEFFKSLTNDSQKESINKILTRKK